MGNDLRYALRQLRRSPVFTIMAVLTLGLGLGAVVTVWSVVHTVLLSPVPYPDPGRLVGIGFSFPEDAPNNNEMGTSADFLQRHAHIFQSTGIAGGSGPGGTLVNLSVEGSGRPARVRMRTISAGYLPTLGITPMLGRGFTAQEDQAHGPNVVLLSYGAWETSFHGNPSIVGKIVHVDEEPYTVVGVMPKRFRDLSAAEPIALWEPLRLNPSQPGYGGTNYIVVGRLRPGVGVAQAQAELATLDKPFYHRYPGYLGWTDAVHHVHGYRVWPLADVLTSNVRASLLAMLAAVAVVLLLACFNLAGLMSTRASKRGQELSVRTALGAGRGRLLRLLVAEGVLIAVAAAVLALLIAQAAVPMLLRTSSLSLPVLGASGLWRQAAFVIAVAVAACLLFTLLPSAIVLRRRPALPGRSTVTLSRGHTRLASILVVLQAGLAMVLLSGASLLLGVFLRLQSTSTGITPEHLVSAQVALRGDRYATTEATSRFVDQVVGTLDHAPGVSGAAAIVGLPLKPGLNLGMHPADNPQLRTGVSELRPVTPGYFQTVGLYPLAGRLLRPSDNAASMHVAVISQTAAKHWWPGQNPIGRTVEFGGKGGQPMQVVGVVPDVHVRSLAEPLRNDMVYAPFGQLPDDITRMTNGWFSTSLVLRVAADVPVAREIDAAVHAQDPELPVSDTETMQSAIDAATAAPRFFSRLSTGFALFALLLSALGLFGLLSYQVTERTRELGLRLALGAMRGRILRMVLRRGLRLAVAGTALGLLAGLALPGFLAALLPQMIAAGPRSAAQLLAGAEWLPWLAALLLVAIAAVACVIPAWRAAQTEPMEALRAE